MPRKPTTKKAAKKTPARGAKTAKKNVPKPPPRKRAPEKKKDSPLEGEALRKHLLRKRDEILSEAREEISKYIKGENRQLVETALDDGDWSVIDLSEDINLRKLGTHHETLVKIDESLRKLKEGTYGICEDCEEEINPERLRIVPFAVRCRDCQETQEEREATEREEGPPYGR